MSAGAELDHNKKLGDQDTMNISTHKQKKKHQFKHESCKGLLYDTTCNKQPGCLFKYRQARPLNRESNTKKPKVAL